MTGVEQDKVSRNWAARGFSCSLWVDPPRQSWEDFVHGSDEVVMIVEGEVEFEIEGEVLRPKPGEELLIPAGTRHSVRNVGKSTSKWLYGYR